MAINPFITMGPEFYNFLLPWLFTFVIVYGLLDKVGLFGDANQKVSLALALVAAFFVTATGGPFFAGFFAKLFIGASSFLAGILVVILFLAILGTEGKHGDLFKSGLA